MAEKQVRVPLGNEMFLSTSVWRGMTKYHIRRYKQVTVPANPNKKQLIPTKYGICLTPQNLHQLRLHIPRVLSDMQPTSTLVKSMETTLPQVPSEAAEDGFSEETFTATSMLLGVPTQSSSNVFQPADIDIYQPSRPFYFNEEKTSNGY